MEKLTKRSIARAGLDDAMDRVLLIFLGVEVDVQKRDAARDVFLAANPAWDATAMVEMEKFVDWANMEFGERKEGSA